MDARNSAIHPLKSFDQKLEKEDWVSKNKEKNDLGEIGAHNLWMKSVPLYATEQHGQLGVGHGKSINIKEQTFFPI